MYNPLVSKIILFIDTHKTQFKGKDDNKKAEIKNPKPRINIDIKGKINIFFLSNFAITSKATNDRTKTILLSE